MHGVLEECRELVWNAHVETCYLSMFPDMSYFLHPLEGGTRQSFDFENHFGTPFHIACDSSSTSLVPSSPVTNGHTSFSPANSKPAGASFLPALFLVIPWIQGIMQALVYFHPELLQRFRLSKWCLFSVLHAVVLQTFQQRTLILRDPTCKDHDQQSAPRRLFFRGLYVTVSNDL